MRAFLFVSAFLSSLVFARDIDSKSLQASRKLGISFDQCVEVESKLGQLLYVNVDNHGAKPAALSDGYFKLVQDLQIGGVIVHSQRSESEGEPHLSHIRKALLELQSLTDLPLLTGVDYQIYAWGRQFGLGYGAGMLGSRGSYSKECLANWAFLEAFLHRATGLNHSLGPTIERSTNKESHGFLTESAGIVSPKAKILTNEFDQLGAVTTLKHFPYTPSSYNLHKKTEDTKLPKEEVDQMLEVFKKLNASSDFAMSTHLYNSNVDSEDMATFSKKWIQILRKDLGFQGILITDGLFMMTKYDASIKHMSSKWPQASIPLENLHSIFAARSILAGHDMAFLEGTADSTRKVFKDLLYVACQSQQPGPELRARVLESYDRISLIKRQRAESLRSSPKIPAELVSEALDIYSQGVSQEKPSDPTAQNSNPVCSSERIKNLKKAVRELGFLPVNRSVSQAPPSQSPKSSK